MSEPEKYVLRGGKRGYDRLLVLARERGPDTIALFHRAGVVPGMKCLDVGCGSGVVTMALASIVGPEGTAVGLDMDGVKLDLARQSSAERNILNVEFRQVNVNEWEQPGTYDVVYSRFLLMHLRRPVDLVRRMWDAVRPAGVLIVEDVDFDGWCCDPPNEGFEYFVRTYDKVLRQNGGDPASGRRVHRYFREVGIPNPHLEFAPFRPYLGEAKSLAWSTLEGSSDAILSAGIATPAELASALADLAKFTADPDSLIFGPRVFQVWANRSPA